MRTTIPLASRPSPTIWKPRSLRAADAVRNHRRRQLARRHANDGPLWLLADHVDAVAQANLFAVLAWTDHYRVPGACHCQRSADGGELRRGGLLHVQPPRGWSASRPRWRDQRPGQSVAKQIRRSDGQRRAGHDRERVAHKQRAFEKRTLTDGARADGSSLSGTVSAAGAETRVENDSPST